MPKRLLLAIPLLLAACASEPEQEPREAPPQDTTQESTEASQEEPIPLTEEPVFERAERLPAFFEGARCVVTGPTASAEDKAFVEAFAREFFQGGFKKLDEAGAQPEFVVRLQLETRSSDQAIRNTAKVVLEGGPSRASRSFSTTLNHDQATTSSQAATLRRSHAVATGRILAKKILANCSQAQGRAVRFEYTLVFKGYERQELRDVRDLVAGLPGVGPDDLSQRASPKALLLTLSSEQPLDALRQAIVDALEEDGLDADASSPQSDVLIFTRT